MPSRLNRREFLYTGAAAATALSLSKRSLALSSTTAPGGSSPQKKGVIDLSASPHAKVRTIPIEAVVIEEGFWSKRRATNVDSSIPSMHDELVDHGRMNNFLRLTGKSNAPQIGPVYSDSDIYKWTEAVGFALQSAPLPQLRQTADAMIAAVVATQEPNGYLNTYYVGEHAGERMLPHTQEVGHELYNIGHLLQGSIAYYRATGDPTLLHAGQRFVDQFLLPNYGPAANQKPIVAGHPEIEMSLIELYRTTGNRSYLELAGYILHGDSRIPLKPEQITYMFCGVPFTSRTHLEGHAVRAMYACCGATDYYLETGDATYLATLNRLWDDLVEHQMYVTGGVGARAQGEAFGAAYELPNARAYGESCAAIGNMMWNWRMLSATGDARHTDVMERALYNGINSGMSLNGRLYCYRNPLAYDPADGDKIRNPWYDTTCCPPNLERTLASLPGYFYGVSDEGLYVHLYDNSELNWKLTSGNPLRVKQVTRYPWEGTVQLTVSPEQPETFTVFVRIPAWSQSTSVKVNGKTVQDVQPGRYLPIRRRWSGSETVELAFDMTPRLVRANPAVTEDTGRAALQRGPVVYCMEEMDQTKQNAEGSADFYRYSVNPDGATTAHYDESLLDGVVVLEHSGRYHSVQQPQTGSALYNTLSGSTEAKSTGTVTSSASSLRLIPYYSWANREDTAMQVWIPYEQV